MLEFLSALVSKLPAEYLMIVVTVLIGFAVYYLPRLRRDKQGKLYIYSKAYDQHKQHHKSFVSQLKESNKIITDRLDEHEAKDKEFREQMKNSIDELKITQNEMLQTDHELTMGQKRLSILNLIQHNPQEFGLICKTYDEYKVSGGNSYIDGLFLKYKQAREGV